MTIINNPADLASAPASDEHLAFLNGLLNDYTIFDDAAYPEGYDRTLVDNDAGYVDPVIRSEWNAGAAAAWGFANRAAVEAAIEAALTPPLVEEEVVAVPDPEVNDTTVVEEAG